MNLQELRILSVGAATLLAYCEEGGIFLPETLAADSLNLGLRWFLVLEVLECSQRG